MSELVSVRLRHRSEGLKAGDVVAVAADVAAYLVENGSAVLVPASKPAKKAVAEKSEKD